MIPRNPLEATCQFLDRNIRSMTWILGLLFLLSAGLALSALSLFPEDLYSKALEAGAKADFAGATDVLDDLESRFPDWSRMDEVLLLRGRMLARLNDYQGAAENWGDLIRRFPQSPAVRTAKASLADTFADHLGEMRSAARLWRELVLQYPDDAEADQLRFRLSHYLLVSREPESVMNEYLDVLEATRARHTRNLVLINLATACFHRQDNNSAKRFLKEAAADRHCSECCSKAGMLLADILELEGSYAEAEQVIELIDESHLPAADRTARLARLHSKAAALAKNLPEGAR